MSAVLLPLPWARTMVATHPVSASHTIVFGNAKLAIHGGFGIYYQSADDEQSQIINNPPFYETANLNNYLARHPSRHHDAGYCNRLGKSISRSTATGCLSTLPNLPDSHWNHFHRCSPLSA